MLTGRLRFGARFRGDDLSQAAAEDHFTAGDLNIDHFAVFGPMPPMLLGCVVPSRAKGLEATELLPWWANVEDVIPRNSSRESP